MKVFKKFTAAILVMLLIFALTPFNASAQILGASLPLSFGFSPQSFSVDVDGTYRFHLEANPDYPGVLDANWLRIYDSYTNARINPTGIEMVEQFSAYFSFELSTVTGYRMEGGGHTAEAATVGILSLSDVSPALPGLPNYPTLPTYPTYPVAPNYFNVNVSVNNSAWGQAVAYPQSGVYGTPINLTATPVRGYEFDRWDVISGSLQLQYPHEAYTNFYMPAENLSIRAVFKSTADSVTVRVNNAGWGHAAAMPTNALPGVTVRLTATPGDGFTFDHWEIVSGNIPNLNTAEANTSFVMPVGDVILRAVFRHFHPSFSVNVSTNNATWGQASASPNYAQAGTHINLHAVPRDSYDFVRWDVLHGNIPGGLNLSSAETAFTMPAADVSVRAVFTASEVYHNLEVSVNDATRGQASATPSSAEPGDAVRLFATAGNGFLFERWEVISGNIQLDLNRADQTISMPAQDAHVRVIFVAQAVTLPEPLPPATPPAHETITIRLLIDSPVYTVNGTPHASDASPFIDPRYNRTMVPLRVIAETLGAEVTWAHSIRTVFIDRSGLNLSLPLGEPLPGGMGTPMVSNDRTFVPIAYVARVLGATVEWDQENRAVYIFE